MFWQELWFNHLARTAPSLTVWGVPLLWQQMMAGVVPLVSLFHAVRRENGFDRLIICLTPGIFILTAGFVMPCFFGSFLGAGFSRVAELRQFLFQPQFFWYCLAACCSAFGRARAGRNRRRICDRRVIWCSIYPCAALI